MADASSVQVALEVQDPWSTKLLDGSKTIETRAYPLDSALLHRPILLVESPPGGLSRCGLDKGRAVGVVVFSACKQYSSRDEWAADSARHGVDPNAPPEAFGWSDAEPKYGWVVETVKAVEERPCPLSEPQRIYRSLFRLSD